jgi:RNA-directed DNA polymerase
MTVKQQKKQMSLAFSAAGRGDAPSAAGQGTEAVRAGYGSESQASPDNLMEEVCQRDNLVKALKRVKANQGSPGIDGMRVEELTDHLKDNWPQIREQLLTGT